MTRRNVFHIFTGNANPKLAQDVCSSLGIRLANAEVNRFPDGEIDVKVHEDVRGADCFIVQPTCPPVNENLMELLLLVDCLRRASADRITAVIPYYGYARQDRKAEGRVPITAKLVANMLAAAHVDRALMMDLHATQIQGFFDIPVDHVFAAPVLIEHIKKKELSNPVILSPDVGSIKQARAYAKRLKASLAVVDKRRASPEETEAVHLIGDVKNKNVFIVDDMISTGTTIAEAVRISRDQGAKDVYVCATHAILCGQAIPRLEHAAPRECIFSDTIPLKEKKREFMTVLSVAGLLGEAIRRIHVSESISKLFV
ncbi:MAG: ribose-phosphate pyrophosphokinase [Planctomycetota bacterium]